MPDLTTGIDISSNINVPKTTKTTSTVTAPLMSLSTAINSAQLLNTKNNLQQTLPLNLGNFLQQLQSFGSNSASVACPQVLKLFF